MNRKKVITYTLAAFVVFYLFTQPAKAADVASGVFDGVMHGAGQLAVFTTSLLS